MSRMPTKEPEELPEIEVIEIVPKRVRYLGESLMATISAMTSPPPSIFNSIPKTLAIDPVILLQERENRIKSRMITRLHELSSLPASMPLDLQRKALIEFHSLRLVEFQRQLRREFVDIGRPNIGFDISKQIQGYKREKKLSLKDARTVYTLEKQREKEERDKKLKERLVFLCALAEHTKTFYETKTNRTARCLRTSKAVLQHLANTELREKKEKEKNEKERMKRLMAEDEEGYRKLIDQKKDTRLAFLLSQTDEYINSLTSMVRQHKSDEKARLEVVAAAAKANLKNLNEDSQSCLTVERSNANISYSNTSNETTGSVATNLMNFDNVEDNPELAGKIIEKAKAVDDEYSAKSGEQNYYSIAHTITEKVTRQATIMVNGELKEYQVKGLEWLVSLYNNNLNGILADEMGLGKTVQAIALITFLMETKNNFGPYLIILPLSTLSNWMLEFEKWAPSVKVISYRGNPSSRKLIQSSMKTVAFNVLLTTYEFIQRDKSILAKIPWKYMIIDEGHRMKNHQSKLTQIINDFYSAEHRLLLTGTPLQNKLPELWALLNFLLPSIFSSCATFETWFNAPFAGEKIELNEEETILIIRRLHKVLRPFLLRRLKKEVESQLPDKVEYLVRCEMSALQKVLYRQMQKDGVLLSSDSSQKTTGMNPNRSLMNIIMQLRKLCNHPFLFPDIDHNFIETSHESACSTLIRVSGKFELLDRILPKLKATGHRILLFCQMTQLITILEDYLNYRGHAYLRLDGSIRSDDRGELLAQFNSPDSKYFIFLLSTRAGGLGLNLQTADTVIIYDSDWNPHQDLQAQDRAHRIGQQKEVRVLRLVTINSVEERILAAARHKLNMDEKVIQAGMFDQKSTGSERAQFLQTIFKNDDADGSERTEAPDDDTINQMISRSESEFEFFQNMDLERSLLDKKGGKPKPRLMQEYELPDWLLGNNAEPVPSTSAADSAGRGCRRRNDVQYDDNLSDTEWLKLIQEDVGDWDEYPDFGRSSSNSRKSKDLSRVGSGRTGVKRSSSQNSDGTETVSKKTRSSVKRIN